MTLRKALTKSHKNRLRKTIERRERDDFRQYKSGTIIGYDRNWGMHILSVDGAERRAKSQTNAAVKLGGTVSYVEGRAHGYFDAMTIG
jgi:hypothetical protein